MTVLYTMLFSALLMAGVALIIYGSYLGLMWFLDRPFTYKAVLEWIGFVAVMALATGGVSYVIPESWHSVMSIVSCHFGCMLAFHVFFFKIQEFLAIYCNYRVSSWILNGAIGVTYALLSFNSMVLAAVHSPLILRIGHMGIEYLTRTAILFSLLLEIKLRTNWKGVGGFQEAPAQPAQEYQDYENQW